MLARHYRLTKLILFGSRARGDHLLDSDYDFVIVSPDFEGIHWLERMSQVMRIWPGPHGIEPLCYTPEEFDRKRQQICIVAQAVKEGVEVPLPSID